MVRLVPRATSDAGCAALPWIAWVSVSMAFPLRRLILSSSAAAAVLPASFLWFMSISPDSRDPRLSDIVFCESLVARDFSACS